MDETRGKMQGDKRILHKSFKDSPNYRMEQNNIRFEIFRKEIVRMIITFIHF